MGITRRGLLAASAAVLLPPGAGRAQEFVNSPLAGRSSDYAAYALPGPHRIPDEPVVVKVPDLGLSVAVFVSRTAPAPRLVVFSHGTLGEPTVYKHLFNQWASHGFAVLAPFHDDSVIERGLRIRQQDARGAAVWDFSGLLNDFALWQARCRTCSQTLDAAERIGATVRARIDASRPVIAGHSYGAFTAQMLVGAAVRTPDGVRTFGDERWGAALLMSPPGIGAMGLVEESWRDVAKPLLAMTGGREADDGAQDAERRSDVFFRSQPTYKHLAFLPEGDQNIYTGQRARPGTYEQRMFDDIRSVTVAFLKAYADHDAKAYENLSGDYFDRHSIEADDPRTRRPKHSRIVMRTR